MPYLVFFLSGFAALLYQVVWQRMLVLFSGADVYSITVIVSAFMGGLGAGSFAGGRVADRIGARLSLRAFAAVEAAIAVCGLLSKPIYYDLLYTRTSHWGAHPLVATIVLIISLLPPTFLMGMSLPLIARALTTQIASAGKVIGSLYSWNTLGAATGAFMTTWMLVPALGFDGSLFVGAAINAACAIATYSLARRPVLQATPQSPAATATSTTLPFAAWTLVYSLTGFIALGLEISWFRMLGVMMKSTSFTFGTVLAIYLAGIGLGGMMGARTVGTSREPGRTFLLAQYAMVWYVAASLIALIAALAAGYPGRLAASLGAYDPYSVTGVADYLLLYGALPLAIVGPPTFLMGFSFPFLQRACQSDIGMIGRRVGVLMAANITGGIAGTALTGFALLPVLGTAATLKLLVILGLLLTWPMWRLSRRRIGWPLAAMTATVAAAVMMPGGTALWARLHGDQPRRVIHAEDGSGLSVLTQSGSQTAVFVNGLGQSWIPYGGIHTVLGALPTLIHPSPANIVIVGLGSGDTAFSAASRPETTTLTCIEIIGAQLTTLQAHAERSGYPGLLRLLSHPRIRHVTGDGRAFVLRSPAQFDIIEMDALRPTSAYAGNLYSREYFDLLRRRLAPNGLAVTWAPTTRILDTFASVFPYVLVFDHIAIGSGDPIAYDAEVISRRAASVAGHFLEAGINLPALLQPYLMKEPMRIDPETPRRHHDLNTDLFPRDEFRRPRAR